MALKIKLARIGAIHNPVYRVVVAEGRSRRDGRFVEILGTYSPKQRLGQLKLNVERADFWVGQGAIPTHTSRSLIKKARKQADQPEEVPAEAVPVAPSAPEPVAVEEAPLELVAIEETVPEPIVIEKATPEAIAPEPDSPEPDPPDSDDSESEAPRSAAKDSG
jgi:small subunit ribosomal protein S16